MAESEETQWLIRTEENWIMRPMSKKEVLDRINRLEIKLNDEICPGNGYWFSIHEKDEVFRNLGIYPPSALWRGQHAEDEITDTETQTLGESSQVGPERSEGPLTDLSPDEIAARDFESDSSTRMMDVPALEKTPEDPKRQQAKNFRTLKSGSPQLPTGSIQKPSSSSVPLRSLDPENTNSSAKRSRHSRSLSPLANADAPNKVVEGPRIWSTLAGILIGVLIGLIYLIARRLGN